MSTKEQANVIKLVAGLIFAGVLIVGFFSNGCGRDNRHAQAPTTVNSRTQPAQHHPYTVDLPVVDQRLGTAVVVLLDTSGSMEKTVPNKDGRQQRKDQIAREALQGILNYSNAFKTKHPDRVLELGIYRFSSNASEVLPIGPFDLAKAQAAIARMPGSSGGTAIGDALEAGFKALYKTGCTRKYVVCITDGENTSGIPPESVGKVLFDQTQGEVEIHFVAFDVDPGKFGFLKQINGAVVPAQDATQLQTRISDIYEKRILAEAPPAEK